MPEESPEQSKQDEATVELDERDKRRLTIANEYHATFTSPSGKIVFADLMKSFYDRVSYSRGDVYETVFREGQRDVVQKVKYMMELSENPKILGR